jgi:hypothetical protein
MSRRLAAQRFETVVTQQDPAYTGQMQATGQFLSPTRQAEILPFETAPRPIAGFAQNYPAGLSTGMHSHRRAQLLYAVAAAMRVDTPASGPPDSTDSFR